MINIRYAQIRKMDISNGEGIGVSLFVQGCHFHCKNCFNSETWDFDDGKEWTEEVKNEFLKLIDRPYIKRISILGGEPLADENVSDILNLVNQIRLLFPNKTIWLYTGYTVNLGSYTYVDADDDYKIKPSNYLYCKPVSTNTKSNLQRPGVLNLVDVVVDGRFEEDKKDFTLKFRGSSNQRVIDAKKSLEQNEIVLWCD